MLGAADLSGEIAARGKLMRLPGVSLGPDYYLTDVFRGRVEYPDLRRKVVELAARHRSGTILIEEAGAGLGLVQDLRSNLPAGMTRPIGIIPKGSKADRMVAQTAKIEAGHVYLPKEAPWLAEFLSELLGFPNARHDDQVDSVSQFLNWAAQRVVRDDRIALPASVGGQGRMRFDYH
jgi:predicted phage terminase large subunit-like protein